MTELQILNAVKNSGGSIDFVELLNRGQTDSNWEPLTDQRLIENLIAAGILSGNTSAYGIIKFGKGGSLRLRDLQQAEDDFANDMANQKSKEKVNRRFQFANTVIGILIGAVCTIAVELVIKLLSH